MRIIHSERHKLRDVPTELHEGELVPAFEHPGRVDRILAELQRRGAGRVEAPQEFGPEYRARVHDPEYLAFLENCWADWLAAGHGGAAAPVAWPSRAMPRSRAPTSIEGRVGYYALAGDTAISDGTWEAACAAADVALSGAAVLSGGAACAFSLCRPPGHHAASDMFGGYCFLNNAAIAAERLRDGGASRVAVLDVDFHHGNGTQEIFFHRGDVLFASIHGDPEHAFPYFLGGKDETGVGAGEGANFNYALPPGTGFARWREALSAALAEISKFGAEALVVSLGVDTYKEDPISFFRLESEDFLTLGRDLAGVGLPTLFVMEGGYAVDAIGVNVANTLEGFEGA